MDQGAVKRRSLGSVENGLTAIMKGRTDVNIRAFGFSQMRERCFDGIVRSELSRHTIHQIAI